MNSDKPHTYCLWNIFLGVRGREVLMQCRCGDIIALKANEIFCMDSTHDHVDEDREKEGDEDAS